MSQDSPLPAPPVRRAPNFTAASWIVLVGGLILTYGVYDTAVTFRRPGEWLPGIGEAIIGTAATGMGSFACSLTAFLRRERNGWMALIPFLFGLLTIVYFTRNLIIRR